MEKSKRNKAAQKPAKKPSDKGKGLSKVNLHVNEFGAIVRDVQTDEINAFLDENVPDKKFLE